MYGHSPQRVVARRRKREYFLALVLPQGYDRSLGNSLDRSTQTNIPVTTFNIQYP